MKVKLRPNSFLLVSSLLATGPLLHATPYTWTNNTTGAQTWTTVGNWATSTVFVDGSANELLFFANTTTALGAVTTGITTAVPATLAMNTLTLNGLANAGASTAINIASSGSTWTLGDGTTSTVNLNGLNNGGGGTVPLPLALSYNVAANLTLNQTSTTFTGNGTAGFLFSGNIGEAAAGYAINKAGSSTLILSGTNAYTGGSTISGGGLVFRNLASKATTGTHAFGANTTLGLGAGGAGFFTTTDIDNAFANSMTGNLSNVTITGTTNIGIDTTAGSLAYSTSIVGNPTNGLVKQGANTLTLSGANTYTGVTTVTEGTLSVSTLAAGGAASNIGAAAAGAAGLVINNGTFSYTGGTATTNRGVTFAGGAASAINVATGGTALTMGASTVVSASALSIGGGAGSSLTLGPITALAAATQINLLANIPTTLGPISYANSTAQETIANRGTSTLTYGDITGPGAAQVLFLGGQGTVNGVISGFTGSFVIGAGGTTVSLLGANTFTGQVDIRQASTVVFNSIKDVNGGASALGAPTSAALGTIIFGQVANNQTLRYIGTGDTTDRVLKLAGSTGTVTLEQAGTGPLKFTSALTAVAGNKTFVLSGSTAGTGEIAGAIVNGGITSLSKTGTGTWTLSGTNTYTGSTSLSGGGTLALNYGTLDTTKLSDTVSALTLGGGTLTLKGATGSHVEVVTSTSLNAGGSFLTRDGANTAKLRMNAITRAAGGTISFGDATIADTDTNNINSILGGWATIGNDWAVSVASGAADTAVTALASYTGALPSALAGANTANYTLTGPQTQTAAVLANTVKITGSGAGDTLDLGANDLTTTYASPASLGGILYAGGGDDNYNITGTGRILTSSTTGELIVTTTTGTLTTSASIVAAGATAGILTKSGAGTLAVNVANTYTGVTNVNQGVLRLMNATASGSTAGGIIVQNGAALELTGGITVGAEALTITGNGISNAGALRNIAGSSNTYEGAIVIGNGGARINADTGTLLNVRGITTAAGANVTFGGAGDITHSTTAISGAGAVIKDGAGTLRSNVANTYTGATTVSQGTLLINGATSTFSTVSVAPNAILGGTGTIGGAVNVSGSLSPGASIETLGTGALSFAHGSTLMHELDSSVATAVGSDLLKVTGDLNLTGTVNLTLSDFAVANAAFSVGTVFSMINYTGSWNNGLFTIEGNEIADEEHFTFGFNIWKMSYNDPTGGLNYTGEYAGGSDSFVNLIAVPEPRAALVGGLGLLALLRRRRQG